MYNFRLKELPTPQKVLISLFLVFMGLAYSIALFNAFNKTGLSSSGVLKHYQGNEAELAYPMSISQLIDITHPHAFIQPLVFLALGLILAGTAMRDRYKIALYIMVFLGVLIDLSLPWLLRFGPPSLALLHILPGLCFTISFLAFITVPLYDLWSNPQS